MMNETFIQAMESLQGQNVVGAFNASVAAKLTTELNPDPVASHTLDISKLVVGDRVGVKTPYTHSDWVAVVTRITPTGRIVVNGSQEGTVLTFGKDGYALAGATRDSRFTRLVPVWVLEEEKANRKTATERTTRAHDLTEKLAQVIRGLKNGHGHVVGKVSDETKAELIVLINSL